MSDPAVQYRVVVTKGDERIGGPDDAPVVITVPMAVVIEDGFDATVEFMRGRLKVSGPTGELFAVLSTGDATVRLRHLADAG